MNRKVWIVRHAERQDFVDPGWVISSARPFDPPLSETGHAQALQLAHHLQGRSIDRIYCSPFLRTVQTAAAVAERLDLPVFVEPGLAEDNPELDANPDMMSIEECSERFQRVDPGYRSIRSLSYPATEAEARRRAAETVRELVRHHPAETILCVSHASPVVGIIRSLCSAAGTVRVPLCGVFSLSPDGEGGYACSGADTSFLRELVSSLRDEYVDR